MVAIEPAKAVAAAGKTKADELQKTSATWRSKLRHIMNNITVEPIVAAYIMPSVLSGLATQNLNLEKACRVNMNYSDTICDALTRRETSNYTIEEQTIQRMVAHLVAWKTIIQSSFPCLLILFWGSWSDRHCRRKPCILLPIVGELLGVIGLMLCVFFESAPMEVAALSESVFPAICGGWFVVLMGVFSYIADITTEEERTLRIGILNVCFSVGVPIGTALSGILLKKIGFYGIFSISAGFYIFSLAYGYFYLPEPREAVKVDCNSKKKSLLGDFFDKDHVLETFRVAFKKGANKRRKRVILLMIVVMVVIGPLYGEMNVLYLFSRYRFNWSEVEFSAYNTFAVVTGLVGTLFSVGILSHKLKIDDALIGVISSTSKILSGFLYAFAIQPWHMYAGAVVEIFNGTSFIAMRSMATKLVNKNELGKVNSLFGVAEALMPVVFAPLYSTIYAATLKEFPGAFFILGSAITSLAVIIFLWMYNFQRKQIKQNVYKADQEASSDINKDCNGKFNTMEAIAYTTESKAHLNGIVVSNVLHEALEHKCNADCKMGVCLHKNGITNAAFIGDSNESEPPNTHL